MKKTSLVVLLGCLTLLAACTKEVPYEYEFKEEVQSKSQISTDEDYLYTASALETSRYTADGRPFWFGDNKRVRLVWTETSLKIMEKERDQRFSNTINDKMILEIPVEHVGYECAKDAYGDCTNKEKAKDANWSAKESFKIKAAEAKSGAIELLPILMDQALGSDCYKEVSSEVQGYEITKDAINIQVRRNYQQNLDCMANIDNSLTETNISSVFHYSLVRASSILSSDFKPFDYSKVDEDTFGFFSSTYKKRDVDTNQVENAEKTVMNHWNPNRKVIDYYLSDEFKKPQHAKLKEATYEAVRQLNLGLKDSGAQFQVVLHEPAGKNPGDIRNSMIVLVEDSYEGAPLGYGPQTEDPLTGEIISARTIMYLAGAQQYVKINYDEIGRALKRELAKAKAPATIENEKGDGSELITEDGIDAKIVSLARAKQVFEKKKAAAKKPSQKEQKVSAATIEKIQKDALTSRKYTSRISDEYSKHDAKAYVKYLTEAKNCSFKAEPGMTEIRADLMKVIADKFADAQGNLKPWTSLSEAQKQEVMDIVIPEIWVPVLLHELGHNMGLRHNFKGSEDTANFYSKAELNKHGINHEIPYSTIMEYGDDLRTLPFLGKYDVAALRYAYAKQVDIKDKAGKVSRVPVVTNIKDLQTQIASDGATLVDYGYCTDEHVGPNPGCRRFDEGESFVDIAQYLIDSYNDRYDIRSRRSGRENFSSMEDYAHARRQLQRFLELRVFSEFYERIKHLYNLSDDSPLWTDKRYYLKEVKEAALLSNRFLMKVIMTPDLHCAIATVDNPNKVIELVPIKIMEKISQDDLFDCSTAKLYGELGERFVVVGQTGKSLNSKKHPSNQNNYIDQIDVRGYWLDKWAAAQALFARNLSSSFNRHFDNAWDIADLQPEVQDMLISSIGNKVVSEESVEFFDGRVTKAEPLPLNFHQGQLVDQALDSNLSKRMGIPNGNVYFSEILAGIVVRESSMNTDNLENGQVLTDLVSVKKTSTLSDSTPAGFISLKVGSTIVYAAPENVIGTNLIRDVSFQRTFGNIERAVQIKLALYLSTMLRDEKVVTAEGLKAAVPELSEALQTYVVKVSEKSLMALTEKLLELINGQLMPESDIAKILFGLPNR